MNTKTRYHAAIIGVFLWIGFVGAISFMEAWIKFQAPGITLSLGLGIGRLVFQALNKVELVFSIVIIASMVKSKLNGFQWKYVYFIIPFVILILQSLWLLPALDVRAQMHINGEDVPSSYLHLYYVIMEVVKVVCLFIFGTKLFKA